MMYQKDFMTKSISDLFIMMIDGILNYIEEHYDEKQFVFDDEFELIIRFLFATCVRPKFLSTV